MIVRLAERNLKTKFGTYREILYYDGQKESLALVMNDIAGKENVLCRVHSHCTGAHIFNSVECECREEMECSQFLIEKEGRGIVIWLDQEAKGNGHLALIESTKYKLQGDAQPLAYQKAGFSADARSYRPAAEILADLRVKSIVLLANSASKADALREASINVSNVKTVTIDHNDMKEFQTKLQSGKNSPPA